MKLNLRVAPAVLSALIVALATSGGQAAPVSTWRTFKASPATVISGETTNDPIVGTTATTAQASRIIGYFTPQSLLFPGDKIILTFNVSFADAVGTSSAQDNFRFALFDRNGEAIEPTLNTAAVGSTNTDDFRGYLVGVDSNTGAPQGSVRERVNSGSVDTFAAATAASLGGANTGTDVTLDDGPTYTGVMTLLRTPTGVDITASFVGNGGANAFAVTDTTPVTTFGAVGFLNGGPLNTDQVLLQDVDVSRVPIPEPATWMLGIGSLVGCALVRRRRR